MNLNQAKVMRWFVGWCVVVVEKTFFGGFCCLLNFENVVSTFCVSLSFLSRKWNNNAPQRSGENEATKQPATIDQRPNTNCQATSNIKHMILFVVLHC